VGKERFIDNLGRLFRGASLAARENLWEVFCSAVAARHGSMITVAADAAEEAQRLATQGTSDEPMLLTPDVFRRVSGIDGAVMVDPTTMGYVSLPVVSEAGSGRSGFCLALLRRASAS
jgi:hypothetical protein